MLIKMTFCSLCLCRVPTIGGKPLDLYHLFMEVTSHGGLEKVCLLILRHQNFIFLNNGSKKIRVILCHRVENYVSFL